MPVAFAFARKEVNNAFLNKVAAKMPKEQPPKEEETGRSVDELKKAIKQIKEVI